MISLLAIFNGNTVLTHPTSHPHFYFHDFNNYRGKNLPPTSDGNPYDDTPRSAARILNSFAVQQKFRESGRKNSEDIGVPRNSAAPGMNGKSKGKEKEGLPKILPQETLAEYNRRIEALLRPSVSQAIQKAESIRAAEAADLKRTKKENKRRARLEKLVKEGKVDKKVLEDFENDVKEKKRKREMGDEGDSEEEKEEGEAATKAKDAKKETKTFAPMPQPRRLNDIVQAPPTLPKLRKAKDQKEGKGVYGAVGNGGKMPLNAGQKRILEEERKRVVRMYREMKAAREAKNKQ